MNTRWRRRTDLLARRAPAGLLVLDPAVEEIAVLTGPAVPLWELLIVERSLADLVTSLAAHHDAEPADVQADVLAAIEELVRRALVVES